MKLMSLNQGKARAGRSSATLLVSSLLFSVLGSGCTAEMLDVIDEILDEGARCRTGCAGKSSSASESTGTGGVTGEDSSVSSAEGNVDSTQAPVEETTDAVEPTQESTEPMETTQEPTDGGGPTGEKTGGCGGGKVPDKEPVDEPKECSDGETRTQSCTNCGTQEQRCEEGKWVNQGACEDSRMCEPGEIHIMRPPQGRFDCGTYRQVYRCGDTCYPTEAIKTVYVSRCGPTDCCGSADGARVACLDPKDLPDTGFCRIDAPAESEIGDTWMTPAMWDEYRASLGLGPE